MSNAADIRALLGEHGTTFAEEAGIKLKDKPKPLFQLLVLTSLLSANLEPRLGLRTARALNDAGLTTAKRMRNAGEDARWQVLADSKYLRKRQTARQLGQLADEVLDRWDGDLRRMRDESDLRSALRDFTGIGPLGVDIFCREVQTVWPDLQPFADDRVLKLARTRNLPGDARKLAKAAGTNDLSRLGAALLFADMADRGRRSPTEGTGMAAKKGKGSETAKKANAKASKEGKKNPRKSSSAQAELGKKGAKAKKKS